MLQTTLTQIGAAAVVVVCLYALIVGSWRERYGALVYLAAYFISIGFALIAPEYTTLYLLLVDVVCLQAFLFMCWRTPHPWPKWALLGQFICVCVELATLAHVGGLYSRSFLTIETAAGWGVLLALLVGTIAAAQARRDARKAAQTG